ncbi:MAG TPA: lipopolysaccharide kinase InaA family protein [Candidatus Hydrogenedentes bacterium]|jgi:3-deoxy-D-manno-octulosonic acid kinase|nr:lipopolysaccharide kinase InaA family protein [Candidatus Hydrogenedentota bacterium]
MLDGYRYLCDSGKKALLRADCSDTVASALLTRAGAVADSQSGRAPVYRFAFERGEGIVRDYRRGGLLARVNRDLYLGNRPLAELRIVDFLWRQGFPVPEPLGICWWRQLGLLRGRIATKALDAIHLQDFLKTGSPSPDLLRRVGETISTMHGLGVRHGDLQVRNILVAGDDPYIIDFDKARRQAHLSSRGRAANLYRLRRSFEKNRLESQWYDAIVAGYGPVEHHALIALAYAVRSSISGPRRGNST